MDNQLRIYIRGGCLVSVESNFQCQYQIIDYDNIYDDPEKYDYSLEQYEPDAVYEGEDLFSKEIE